MSWASRRRTLYGLGTLAFLALVVGGPLLYQALSVTPTCTDGIRNQGETSIDKGGPCLRIDASATVPLSTLWTRAFRVRDGLYSAIAYVQNPNPDAGIQRAAYRFELYDDRNVLIAERDGTTSITPGASTPIFEGGIDTGNRIVAHTYFTLIEPLAWERLSSDARTIKIGNRTLEQGAQPRISATASNTLVRDIRDVRFVIIVADQNGNAIAASETRVPLLKAGASEAITFTWPDPFSTPVGSVDITAILAPSAAAQ